MQKVQKTRLSKDLSTISIITYHVSLLLSNLNISFQIAHKGLSWRRAQQGQGCLEAGLRTACTA